jgi:hypothetical protein
LNRDEAVWYYRLGGRTLGPVDWVEIEQLTRDTVEPEHLLVAQGGDAQWRSAAAVLEEMSELKAPAEPEPAEEPEGLPVTLEEPSPAAADVLVQAAQARETGRPAPPASRVAGEFTPEHGLGKWVGQAWEMVIGEVWAWVGALVLMALIGGVTFGIAGPPLMAGLYVMALKRYRGEGIRAGDIFDGFSRFLGSWGLTLIMSIPAVLLMAPLMILFAIPAIMAQGPGGMEEIGLAVGIGMQFVIPIIWLLVMAVQTIFFYSWVLLADGHGAWDAVAGSWEKVRLNFWSYLGIWLVLSILASLGSYACYVGLLLTYPLLPCAQVAAYMWHFRRV